MGQSLSSPRKPVKKLKRVRVQIGDDLDLNLGFRVSPRAVAFISAVAAGGGGYWGYLLQR